ncbi:MFS transporter [Nakamurella sp. YIM 132087]|uniref:MFS transporter n=1 Tax=Nakamurella alba TaxID=2665158 RepID=A0A7K1FTG5_9ACTN|nr:MFS transporter [Nakamurella alba]
MWRGPLLRPTLGSFALVFLAAFEALAVTTVMPAVSEDLQGGTLYALAFAGPLAAGVIGMVTAGALADRRGPAAPLVAAVLFFVVGLLVAGLAPTMPVLVVGRLIQGLGAGGTTVALYVLVARVYPPPLHPKIFAAFSAAWVLPALVGPALAGLIEHAAGWRWVFLGVVLLVVPAGLALAPALRDLRRQTIDMPAPETQESTEFPWSRLAWALLGAIGVLALDLSGRLPSRTWIVIGAIVAAAVTVLAVRPLLPRGTLRAARGLPAVVLTRGAISATFFGTEVYLPYLLVSDYGFAAGTAGLALTAAGLAWALTSQLQGRLGERLPDATAVRWGAALVLIGVAGVLATAAAHGWAVLLILAWAASGAGMGLAYARLTVLTLSGSTPGNQGFNSAALSIADSLGSAMALAVTGMLSALLTAGGTAFVPNFVLTTALGVLAVTLSLRVRPGRAATVPARQ